MYRRDRDSTHGGVCIYDRKDSNSSEVLNNSGDERGVEHIWCRIRSDADKVLEWCINRPPNSDPRVLEELLKSIKRAKDKIANYGTKLNRKRTKLNIAVNVKNSLSH